VLLPTRAKSDRQWQAVSVAAGILQTHLNYDGEKIGAVLGFVGTVAGEGLAARCAASIALRQVAEGIWHDLANVSVAS